MGFFNKNLLSKVFPKHISIFEQANNNVIFQNYVHPIYKQLHKDFIPNLSVVDLLFNCGPKSNEIIMSNNISKQTILEGQQ